MNSITLRQCTVIEAQKKFYHDNGYLLGLPPIFTREEMARRLARHMAGGRDIWELYSPDLQHGWLAMADEAMAGTVRRIRAEAAEYAARGRSDTFSHAATRIRIDIVRNETMTIDRKAHDMYVVKVSSLAAASCLTADNLSSTRTTSTRTSRTPTTVRSSPVRGTGSRSSRISRSST